MSGIERIVTILLSSVRTKIVICGSHFNHPLDAIASYGFQVYQEPSNRKGKVKGQRAGLLLDIAPVGKPVA